MARDYLLDQTYREAFTERKSSKDLCIIVVIPSFKEKNIIESLASLKNCDLPKGAVEVIVVINQSEKVSAEDEMINLESYEEAIQWTETNQSDRLRFFIHYEKEMPRKHAGVGLARKIGMDEALRRFKSIDKPNGIILCYDADSKCTTNYLQAVEKHFEDYPNTPGCSIHFEHPVQGNSYSTDVYTAIVQYELHLRYYRQALLYAKHPYAYHTIGSSMAVRAEAYEKQGGMNRRKAGEDFYFLQKIIALGGFTELNVAHVIPSPRPSDRVPFGTGKAVNDRLVSKENTLFTYHPQLFEDLRQLLSNPQRWMNPKEMSSLPDTIKSFLKTIDVEVAIAEILKNTSNPKAFEKRFFKWFNAFIALKYVHFGRDHFYPNIPIGEAADELLKKLNIQSVPSDIERLFVYRKLDKKAI